MAKTIHWDYVKPLFRAGYSLRQCKAKYEAAHPDMTVSIEAIRRAAKRFGWKRDLTKDIADVTERKVAEAQAEKTAGKDADSPPLSDEEVIEQAASAASDVVLTHRDDGKRLRELVNKITKGIETETHEEVRLGRGNSQKIVKLKISSKEKTVAVRNLAFALGKAVEIERKSHNLDRADGGADGVFLIKTSIPEPDPLPEDI